MISATVEQIISLFKNRHLAWATSVHDLKSAYHKTYLGLIWAVLRPVFAVATYVFVISVVFQVRSPRFSGHFDYALYILAGLVPWVLIVNMLNDASMMVRNRMELVKQVVYPIESLPLTAFISHMLFFLTGYTIFIVLALINQSFSPTFFLLPIPLLLLFAFLIGMSWILMILGVVFGDIREVTAILLAILIYMSPVLLHEDMVSDTIWQVLMFNPLAHVILCFRDVISGEFHPLSWLIFVTMSVTTLVLGATLVKRTKLLINEYL